LFKEEEEREKKGLSHKSTRMSDISCEREEEEDRMNKTQDNEIKDLKLNRRGKNVGGFFAGDDRCKLCSTFHDDLNFIHRY